MMNSNNFVQTDTLASPRCVSTMRAIQRLDNQSTTPLSPDAAERNPLFIAGDIDQQALLSDEDDPELRAWLEVCRPDWQETGGHNKMTR